MRGLLLASVLLASALLPGCSQPANEEAPWHGRDLEAAGWESKLLEAGSVYELVYPLQPGQSVAWDWVVPSRTKVEFLVHTHTDDGRDVLYNTTTAAEHKGKLVARDANMYGLMWTNDGPDDALLWLKVPLSPYGPRYYGPASA